MRHFGLILCLLGMASLACNLGSAMPVPTDQPSPTLLPTSTVQPTSTSVPSGASPSPTTCTVRTDWPIYSVISGDTLSDIAVRTGSATTDLLQANCLSNPNTIHAGRQLRVPRYPATPQLAAASIGQLSISPSGPTPGQPDLHIIQPGSTVTLRIDGLRNIVSVKFIIPPPGWNGNGFTKTDPLPVQDVAVEYTFTVPTDKPQAEFYFSTEAMSGNGQVLMSNIVHAGIASATASIGQLSISPSGPTPGQPDLQVIQPGSTVTLHIDGLRNIASVRFIIPPPGWNGNGFTKTDPLPIQNGIAEYTFMVPTDKPQAEFYFSAEAVGVNGEQLASNRLRVGIARSNP